MKVNGWFWCLRYAFIYQTSFFCGTDVNGRSLTNQLSLQKIIQSKIYSNIHIILVTFGTKNILSSVWLASQSWLTYGVFIYYFPTFFHDSSNLFTISYTIAILTSWDVTFSAFDCRNPIKFMNSNQNVRYSSADWNRV